MGAGVGMHKLLPSRIFTLSIRAPNASQSQLRTLVPLSVPTPALSASASASASALQSSQQPTAKQPMDVRTSQSSALMIKGVLDALLR